MFRTIAPLALLLLPAIAAADDAPVFGPELPPAPAPVVAAPGVAPVVVVPVARPADLQRRWGVSARAVSLTLASTTGGDATKSEYGGGGIAASYRINRRWEVALALDMLDAPQGPDLHSTSITARFHITPHRPWDWYALAGIGVLHEAPLEGAEQTEEDPGRGRFHAGIGLARRWQKWSLAAELHTVGVGPKEMADPMSTARETPTAMSSKDTLSGGELTLAATFFF